MARPSTAGAPDPRLPNPSSSAVPKTTRCARGEGAPLPTPVLEPEAEGHLGFDPASWECGWMTATQVEI